MLKLFNNRISKEVTNPLRGLLEIITLAISKKLFQEIKNETKKIIDDDIDKVWDDFIKNPGSYIESIPISVIEYLELFLLVILHLFLIFSS